tara:strand:+ start:1697 stop:2320 length:624 start_codon:yes stop_codon:yes gene_type:complete
MLRRRFCLLSFIGFPFLVTSGSVNSIASTQTEQAKFVNSLIDKAIEILELPIENRAERQAGFRNLVQRDFDMPTIVRLVLGRHWRAATTGQKARFSTAFLTHLISVYSDGLGMYDGQILEIEKSAPLTERDTVVFTHISREGALPLRLDWRVRQTNEGLKVIDIATEGVSMVTTKRSEFTSLVAREGLEALISRLENMNNISTEDSS